MEQLGIIPNLLRNKLLAIYDELPDTEKSGLKELNRPLRRQQEQLEICWLWKPKATFPFTFIFMFTKVK